MRTGARMYHSREGQEGLRLLGSVNRKDPSWLIEIPKIDARWLPVHPLFIYQTKNSLI